MIYFRFEEVDVEDFIKNLPSNYIATQGLSIRELSEIINKGIKDLEAERNQEAFDNAMKHETKTIDKIFAEIPTEQITAIEEEMEQIIMPKKQKKAKKEKLKPVVNNTLTNFLNKHKFID